jgi:hypothetical protein
MRRLRDLHLLAAALGLALGTANPASVLAHALAHHRDDPDTHRHVTSLEAHDGRAELSTRDHARTHQHVRLEQAKRTCTDHLLPSTPVTASETDFEIAPSIRVGVVLATSVPNPDPPGDDPPRLRAPPLH